MLTNHKIKDIYEEKVKKKLLLQPRTKYLEQNRVIKKEKFGQEKKRLVYVFACFLTATHRV